MSAHQLAAVLEQCQEEIIASWVERLRRLPDSHYPNLSLQELRASAAQALDAMSEALATGSRDALEAYLNALSLSWLRQGFESGQVTEALLSCEDAVSPALRRACSSASEVYAAATYELAACLRWMAGRFNTLYAAEMKRQLQAEEARTSMMLEVVQTASSTLELDEVVHRIRSAMAMIVPGSGCSFYLLPDARWTPGLEQMVEHPIERDAFMLEAIARKEPLICYDAETDPRTLKDTVRAGGIKSMMAVPFVVKGQVLAVAFIFTRDNHHAFTREELDLAWGIANVVGLAIKNAWLYREAEQLAVMEERARLAREMHDDLAQRLGALQLVASLAGEFLAQGQVDVARDSLVRLQDMISQAYAEVREDIYNLRAVVSPELGFLEAFREYLVDYRRHYGVDVQLEIYAEEVPDLAGQAQVQALRILQEALTNVRKHASAQKVWVRIMQDADRVRISVEDDGRGFDRAGTTEQEGRDFGLRVMQERAESVGGTLDVVSQLGHGTCVVLEVPVVRNRGSA